MIDTDIYEGHTPAPWLYDLCYENGIIVAGEERITIVQSKYLNPTPTGEFDNIPHDVAVANIHLIADAPLLLERVIHLEHILKCAKDVLTNIYTYDKDLEDAEWIAWFCDMEDEEE